LKWFEVDKEIAQRVAQVLKAIAHPTRLQIVDLLVADEMSVGEIAETLGEKQSITSQQLNMMKDKGVLGCRREGARVYYYIKNKSVIELLACVHKHCKQEKEVNNGREDKSK